MKKRSVAGKTFEAVDPSSWDKLRLQEILRQFEKKRILVFGDVGIDRYTVGSVERISPEAPVPIVLVEHEELKLGLAANVADNIQALGAKPFLVGVIGSDRAGQDFKKLVDAMGISPSHLVTDRSRRTVLKERVVSERQQLLRVDYESLHHISREIEEALFRKVDQLIARVDGIILEDYAKGMLGERLARRIFQAAKRAGKIVSVDPNAKSSADLYKGARVLTPNTKEAEKLSGISIRDEQSLNEAGRMLLSATGAVHVVITRGKEGMAIFSKNHPAIRLIPTYAREVYDVSGAGDTVISVLTLALASGASIVEACVLGNLAAGVEVGKRGTATVSPDEIRVAMEFHGALGR